MRTPHLAGVNRRASLRPAALLVALLFLLSWAGDSLGFHPCPHHDLLAAAHAAGMEHGGTHAHAAGHHDASSPAAPSHQGHDGPCTCLSYCCSAAPAMLSGVPAVQFAALLVHPHHAPAADAASARPRLLPYVLPYGQAPPSAG
ncbi:MAG: hypothetical protein JWM27_4463 [Gemmatimonadetes bacterium]|nr:hypothetical protein [Gemmatimonadota bacterium]